ncbi:YcjF family protein [Nitrospirillum sp. BR 11828]|uniref:YcjF family protein n=1 Tax=Nitrospirillum sp. BR 11828 TaxID=3104325 RepID=UPI002ACA0B10|nr:DUF697 domain-containing protein [Nitrospirillum sp. BR 11828]MDZ5645858.1 DUF697 domain-containing protein [Nitrospirillum sp. BR 11828]
MVESAAVAPTPAVVHAAGESVRGDLALTLLANNKIKDYVVATMALSAVPLPIVDLAGITLIQLRMVQKLSQLYGKPFSKELGTSVLASLAGTFSGLAGGMAAVSLLKLVPGVGEAVALAGLPVATGAMTYAVGKVFVRHYEDGGSLLDLDTLTFKDFIAEQFETGKKLARQARQEAKEKAKQAKKAAKSKPAA